jgi:hypothetical protein
MVGLPSIISPFLQQLATGVHCTCSNTAAAAAAAAEQQQQEKQRQQQQQEQQLCFHLQSSLLMGLKPCASSWLLSLRKQPM